MTCAVRDDSIFQAVIRKTREKMTCAAKLEGACSLEIFALEKDLDCSPLSGISMRSPCVGCCSARNFSRRNDWCSDNLVGYELGCFAHIPQRGECIVCHVG